MEHSESLEFCGDPSAMRKLRHANRVGDKSRRTNRVGPKSRRNKLRRKINRVGNL